MALQTQIDLAFRNLLLHLKLLIKSSSYSKNISREEIHRDTKELCADYIDDRLIRSGLQLKSRKLTTFMSSTDSDDQPSSDATLSRSLSLSVTAEDAASLEALRILSEKRYASSGCKLTTNDLSQVLTYLGETLELRHINTYTDVLQQLSIKSLSEVNLRRVYVTVAKEIFKYGTSWAKIVSLLAFSGGLAVDCVLNGSPIYVSRIKSWAADFVDSELSDWIQEQGGWIDFFDHFTNCPKSKSIPSLLWPLTTISIALTLFLAIVATVLGRR